MEFKNLHTNRTQVSFDKENKELHQKDFGFEVPKDFFETSKKSILEQTVKKSKKIKVIKLISFTTSIAAILLLFFTVFNSPTQPKTQVALNDAESKMLINSLLVNDKKLDKISDSYMLGTLYTEEDLLN